MHKMIDKEIAAGTNPNNVFVCGFSQGGLSLSLSVFSLTPGFALLYNNFDFKIILQVL